MLRAKGALQGLSFVVCYSCMLQLHDGFLLYNQSECRASL